MNKTNIFHHVIQGHRPNSLDQHPGESTLPDIGSTINYRAWNTPIEYSNLYSTLDINELYDSKFNTIFANEDPEAETSHRGEWWQN